jgi:hypothetical protein
MNGPLDVSFDKTPTFFWMRTLVSCLILHNGRSAVTHACCLDVFIDVGKELLILFSILASNEDVERNLSALQRFQMLG